MNILTTDQSNQNQICLSQWYVTSDHSLSLTWNTSSSTSAAHFWAAHVLMQTFVFDQIPKTNRDKKGENNNKPKNVSPSLASSSHLLFPGFLLFPLSLFFTTLFTLLFPHWAVTGFGFKGWVQAAEPSVVGLCYRAVNLGETYSTCLVVTEGCEMIFRSYRWKR